MKVICRKKYLSEEQNTILGYTKDNRTSFELTVGEEYTVLGISFQTMSPLNKGTILLLRDDIGRCAFIPVCLVDVSNAIPSIYWRAKKKDDFSLSFWPEEFFAEYFHDDLSDGIPEIKEVFDRVCQTMEREGGV